MEAAKAEAMAVMRGAAVAAVAAMEVVTAEKETVEANVLAAASTCPFL